jgi:hypothetical protein
MKVRANAFVPPSTSAELSVFLTEGLAEAEVWTIAVETVDSPPSRVTKARGDFHEGVVVPAGLDLVFDDSPPRHANILGWPPDKSERKLLAKKLADTAGLVIRPVS